MKVIVDFSSVVKAYAPRFESLFSPSAYLHFKKALTGFIVSENKTIEGINRLFVKEERNQSSFNRFFTRSSFDIDRLNVLRLQMLQQNAGTQFQTELKTQGVLAIDDTLLKHYGRHFDNIYNLKDYVEGGYKWSHDLITLHYCNEQTDYPVFYHLWQPPQWEQVALFFKQNGVTVNQDKWNNRNEEPTAFKNYMRSCYSRNWKKHPSVLQVYKHKIAIASELIDRFIQTYPDLKYPVVLDYGFSSSYLCDKITTEYKRDYVGSLRGKHTIITAGSKLLKLEDFVQQLKAQHFDPTISAPVFQKVGVDYKDQKRYFYVYHKNHSVKSFKQKQRLLICYDNEQLNGTPYYIITNRTDWHPSLILRLRRHRWSVETYHQEGKREGLDKYQVRKLRGIETHIALVVLTYTMLQHLVHDPELLSSIQQRLQIEMSSQTLPFLRRMMQAESMLLLVEYLSVKINQGESVSEILKMINGMIAYQ